MLTKLNKIHTIDEWFLIFVHIRDQIQHTLMQTKINRKSELYSFGPLQNLFRDSETEKPQFESVQYCVLWHDRSLHRPRSLPMIPLPPGQLAIHLMLLIKEILTVLRSTQHTGLNG